MDIKTINKESVTNNRSLHEMETNTYWGYHLMLDCSGCNIEVQNPETIRKFNNELVERIEMVPYGLPQIVRFGEGHLAGITLMQLIETSNINCHFCDNPSSMYLDVFSCKLYNTQTVVDVVKKYFDPQKIRVNYITRHAN